MENENTEKVIKASRFEVEQQLNQFVGGLKVEGVSAEGKLALVKLKLELSKIVDEINEFRKKTTDSIEKPENYDELKAASEKEVATKEDKEAYKTAEEAYNKKFAEIAIPYFNSIVDIEFDMITKEDFYEIIKHNDLNVIYGYEYIYNKLVKK